MRRPLPWLVVAVSLLISTVAGAQLSRTGTPAVAFTAAGPAGMKIEGKTSELEVADTSSTVKITVKLAALDTGIALRNRHMREKYLETDKFPTAELVIDHAVIQTPADGSEVKAGVPARITIHGQTKPVTITYKARRTGQSYEIEGATRVNMNDFGITVPTYLGVTVKPEVDIAVRFSVLDS